MKVFGRSKWSTGLCSSCQVANDVVGSIRTVGSFFAKQWNFTRTMGRYASLEYGHYGNPTTEFQEKKIRWLHRDGLKGNAKHVASVLFKSCRWKPNSFRFLKIVGVGFKAGESRRAPSLYLKLGYNHEVEPSVPLNSCVLFQTQHSFFAFGTDKRRVHQFFLPLLFTFVNLPRFIKAKVSCMLMKSSRRSKGKKSK
ncbi:hypothetical protein IFM89_030277 [Coptis chinensis]|uniref:Ribosomal protein L6 n=1 Tax=Coptis chinensis TaxID=261450 RepID=A0A835INI3_9MAGN|nr:hypothetical protein IFM89_030277 [Coptis chinensis]